MIKSGRGEGSTCRGPRPRDGASGTLGSVRSQPPPSHGGQPCVPAEIVALQSDGRGPSPAGHSWASDLPARCLSFPACETGLFKCLLLHAVVARFGERLATGTRHKRPVLPSIPPGPCRVAATVLGAASRALGGEPGETAPRDECRPSRPSSSALLILQRKHRLRPGAAAAAAPPRNGCPHRVLPGSPRPLRLLSPPGTRPAAAASCPASPSSPSPAPCTRGWRPVAGGGEASPPASCPRVLSAAAQGPDGRDNCAASRP